MAGNTIGDIDLPADGQYSVLIDVPLGFSDPFDATFHFDDRQPLPVDIPVNATPLTIGTTVMTGTGSQQHYTISLTEPGRFLFDAFTTRGDVIWSLIGPYSDNVEDRSVGGDLGQPTLLLGPGDHLLTLEATSSNTDPFSFRLLDLADATPLGLDTPTTVSISNDAHMFRFDATAGDEIALMRSPPLVYLRGGG